MAARFSRAPRRAERAFPSARYEMAKRVQSDERFRKLPARAQSALLIAVVKWADGAGRFWPKTQTWADECGCSRSTIVRAIKRMIESGLLWRTPYLRPDGTQGSTTYELDPTSWRESESPCAEEVPFGDDVGATRWRNREPLNRVAQDRASRTGETNRRTLTYREGGEAKGRRELAQPDDPVLAALRRLDADSPEVESGDERAHARRATRAWCESLPLRERRFVTPFVEACDAVVVEPDSYEEHGDVSPDAGTGRGS